MKSVVAALEGWRNPTVDGNRFRARVPKRFQKGVFIGRKTTLVIPDTSRKTKVLNTQWTVPAIFRDFARFVGTIDVIIDVTVNLNVTV